MKLRKIQTDKLYRVMDKVLKDREKIALNCVTDCPTGQSKPKETVRMLGISKPYVLRIKIKEL